MIKSFEKTLIELISKHKIWAEVINWFVKYKPKDKGIKFIWDSLFTDKYLQSFHMYMGMLKFTLNLYKAHKDKNFPYEYSSKRINAIALFFKERLKLSQGSFAGLPFDLDPNQVYKLSLIYGLSKKENLKNKSEKNKGIIFPVNRFYDVETRKNGKSEFFGGLSVFLALNPFGNDAKPEIYATGPKQEASKLIYEKSRSFVRGNKLLRNEFEAYGLRRFQTHSGGTIKDLPYEKDAIEGRNPSLGVATEYHLHPTDTMIESFESAMNMSRINSLMAFDTTKGLGIYGVAYNREMNYKDLDIEQLESPNEIIGINIATFMAEVDKEDMPEDVYKDWENNPYRKSTPMLNKIVSLEKLRQEWKIAERDPQARVEFLIKKFGRWIGNRQSMFKIEDMENCNEKWKDKYKLENFKGKRAMIAIDLANSGDTNAITLMFKDVVDGIEIPIIHTKIFVPKKTLNERIKKEKKPYLDWVEKDFVRLSGDSSVDYEEIANYISELIQDYNIEKIYYDPYQAHIIENYLVRMHGISKVYINKEESSVKQSASVLSSPMEDLISKVVNWNFYYFGNPVVIEHFVNMVPSWNSQNQIYWSKQKQEHRVDIFATCVTAMFKFGELPVYTNKSINKFDVWSFN